MLLNDLIQVCLIFATLEVLLDCVAEAVGLVRETGTFEVFIDDIGAVRVSLPDPIEDFKQVLLCDLLRVCCHLIDKN